MQHGRVLHGTQFVTQRQRPTTYYSPDSGIGEILTDHPGEKERSRLRIGVVGLGVGTIAAYGRPGDLVRFYEINPAVIRLAATGPGRVFTYISDSSAHIDVVPGDARLSLEQELSHGERQNFDVLVIDAFSGDAIPIHLVTHEAFQLYLQHLKPNGILAFHVSNNTLDLSPVIGRLAAESGMSAYLERSHSTSTSSVPSKWIIVTSGNTELIPDSMRAHALPKDWRFPLWTDEYSNLVRVLQW
jgi:spermidine synthase